MRRLFPCSLRWLFLIGLAAATPAITWANAPSGPIAVDSVAAAGTSRTEEADGVLDRGLNQERRA